MNVKNKITELEAMGLLGLATMHGTMEQVKSALKIVAQAQSERKPLNGGAFVCKCGATLPDGHVDHSFGANLCETCIDAKVDTI